MSVNYNPHEIGAENAVNNYYDRMTEGYFLRRLSDDHIHYGAFEPGECPNPGDYPNGELRLSEGYQKALTRMVTLTTAPGNIQPGFHVVDAGCGVGGSAILMAKMHNCKVTGVNINEHQIEIATKKAKKEGLEEQVKFVWGNCSKHLPFEDNSIDTVINIDSACHYDNRAKFLHEVSRILKPGGRITTMDELTCDPISDEDYAKYIQPFCDAAAIFGLESKTSYSQKLQDAGLDILEFEDFGKKVDCNFEILKFHYTQYMTAYFAGVSSPEFVSTFNLLSTLYSAWINGYFKLMRYCAFKPVNSS